MEENISFEDLGLDETTLAAVAKKGFVSPSPIQVLAIPRLLEGDANVIAKARTGTGKTAAFGLPLVQTIREASDSIQALVLTPTRELALQVCKEIGSFATGAYPRMAAVYGGQSMGVQLKALRKGVEIVVGTPGRVQDHLERGTLDLSKIKYFILDEADEMLDMGFIEDIENIFAKANPDCRILLFSATMPPAIVKIAGQFMGEYETVAEEASPEAPILTEQKYIMVRERDKLELVVRLIDVSPDFYGLIFTQTKVDADNLTRQLDERGYEVAALHGDISQQQREKILLRFRSKKTRILVATDVAARGIDIGGLTHVINYSIPFDSSTYIHRIGRTGRAGSYGEAITLVRPEEKRKLEHLKSAIRKAVKGSLQEDTVPSVKKILELKRSRLFDSMKEAVWGKVDDTESVVVDEEKDASQTGLAEGQLDMLGATGENQLHGVPTVTHADVMGAVERSSEPSIFEQMAADLCGDRDPQEILASVLENFYGQHLDASRYGHITPVESQKKAKGGRDSRWGREDILREGGRRDRDIVGEGQKRIYVQLGRRDKFFVREIAEFFSDLLDIPQRLVDGIVVKDSFSLVSLPIEAADRALEMSQRDNSVPHMHLDEKPAGAGKGGRKKGRSNQETSFGFQDEDQGVSFQGKGRGDFRVDSSFGGGFRSGKDRFGFKGKKGGFGGGQDGGRRGREGRRSGRDQPPFGEATNSYGPASKKGTVRGGGASLYKRKLPK
ncbi:MAG: DEAD/DEAH box helicase [Spirochaetaceae bacterium]|nr:DEAD/DEAH box helicase [Spirochaetaceae bacterium]